MNERVDPVRSIFNRIQHEGVKDAVWKALTSTKVKLSVWLRPSSSSGKFHPDDERGEGGAALHAKRVAKIAEDLARAFDLTPLETDFMLAAAILHDVLQYKEESDGTIHTRIEHGEDAVDLVPHYFNHINLSELCAMMRKHSGKWSSDTTARIWSSEVNAIPRTVLLSILFHIADYIASRAYIKTEVE